MTEYRTGENAPHTGTYTFVRHIGNTSCSPTYEERHIPLSADEKFPPCKSCNTGVIWND